MFLDFHAHANINNVFMFGNTLDFHVEAAHQDQVTSCFFPFLLSINSPLFDYNKCILNDKNLRINEGKDSEGKDGAGRVAAYTKYGVVHSYTLEAGYNVCTCISKSYPPLGKSEQGIESFFLPKSGKDELAPNLLALCKAHKFENQAATYFFTQSDYEAVGREVLPSLLDLIDRNPISRVYSTSLRNIRVVLLHQESKAVPRSKNIRRAALQVRAVHEVSVGVGPPWRG